MNRFPVSDTIILGNLNTDNERLRNLRDKKVADFLASFEMVDVLVHFWQLLRYHNLQM